MYLESKLSILPKSEGYVYDENGFPVYLAKAGKKFNIPHGKLILSLFRIVAAGLLVVYLNQLRRLENISTGLLVSFSLILAGALGNIVDSAFYGLLFSASYSHGLPAEFLPASGGYAGFLHGKVVDMFYFPIYEGIWPNWLPRIGGSSFTFFGPVFNIADIAISWGVVQILLFHRSFFQESKTTADAEQPQEVIPQN